MESDEHQRIVALNLQASRITISGQYANNFRSSIVRGAMALGASGPGPAGFSEKPKPVRQVHLPPHTALSSAALPCQPLPPISAPPSLTPAVHPPHPWPSTVWNSGAHCLCWPCSIAALAQSLLLDTGTSFQADSSPSKRKNSGVSTNREWWFCERIEEQEPSAGVEEVVKKHKV